MKNLVVKIATLSLLLVFFVPQASLAETEDDLSNVTFRAPYADGVRMLREGTQAAWDVLKPYAAEHGISKFPRSYYQGFRSRQEAGGNLPYNWAEGYATYGRAYVVVPPEQQTRFPLAVPHEATHLVQYAVAGESDIGSSCITEGAAEWYGRKTLRKAGGNITVHRWPEVKKFMILDIKVMEPDTDNLPSFANLHSRATFNGLHDIAYPLCFMAFDLLMLQEGGEEAGSRAYFNYLSELRRTDWRTAFNGSFSEDIDAFTERFEFYKNSGFEEYKFPREIERENFIKELLERTTNCTPMQLRYRVCIQ